jgi:glycerol-3-phosphate dehydrogenase (NAD(P)+)
MARRIAVVGAGAWGTALAAHAARLGHRVRLWAREPDVVLDVNARHSNGLFLEGLRLPAELVASADAGLVLDGAEIVVFVPPSQFLREVAGAMAAHVPADARVVIASKGIEESTLLLMHQVASEALRAHPPDAICALSGPSFAKEVASGLPTDVVVASRDPAARQDVADALHAPMFRVYTSGDPIGVEVGGALKNVVAIAAGACDGLGLGMNARAAIVTRGISEMARFGVALGGEPLTFMGLSGMGDLVLTATGALSRNRQLGIKVAEGLDPKAYLAAQRTVAEGFSTAHAAWLLAQKLGVDAPITEQVNAVLHEGRPLLEAMRLLMTRSQKDELSGISSI